MYALCFLLSPPYLHYYYYTEYLLHASLYVCTQTDSAWNNHTKTTSYKLVKFLAPCDISFLFTSYRGGLDVVGDQTGEESVYTVYKGREIMFHVSTLLPFDEQDTQHVMKIHYVHVHVYMYIACCMMTIHCPSLLLLCTSLSGSITTHTALESLPNSNIISSHITYVQIWMLK